jgi:2-succinyl-5-enolpyruvyl-6-hydroxy-3-cyclohexene-1-carboxylate synthase
MVIMNSSVDIEAQGKLNTLVGALAIEVLARLGVNLIVTAPGSRSTALTVAAANNKKVDSIAILDERSAGFFALGAAKASGKPVALICTSGTAAANFYPAIIEAQISNVPLIVLTCDRPFELRNCSAGQVIDQIKLYGDNVNAFYEIGLPENTDAYFNYLRQTLVHTVTEACGLNKGPMHLNFSFREPFQSALDLDAEVEKLLMTYANVVAKVSEQSNYSISPDPLLVEKLTSHSKGLVIVGDAQDLAHDPEAIENIVKISKLLGWPILADVLNPLRNRLETLGSTSLITHYDLFLRDESVGEEVKPTATLQIGAMPTSKVLRSYLKSVSLIQFLLGNGFKNIDPLNAHSIPLIATIDALARSIEPCQKSDDWISKWHSHEADSSVQVDQSIQATKFHFEGKLARLISENLPANTNVFLANSMTVRYAESFWKKNSTNNSIFCNRGANGIDGTLSTAMGMAYSGKPSLLITGDLAFLHDSNGLLNAQSFLGDLLVIVVNNEGGGIFEHLPISKNQQFEKYFATPQTVDFKTLCKAHAVNYEFIADEEALIGVLQAIQGGGLKVVEIKTNRKNDVKVYKQINQPR